MKIILTIQEHWRRSRWLKSCLVLLLMFWLVPLGITQAVRLGQYFKFLHTRKLPGPTWRGLSIGQSTLDDVRVVMGEPLEIWTRGDEIHYAYRDVDMLSGKHSIVMRNNIVEWIREDTLYYPKEAMLTDFVAWYGKPDSVQWSPYGERVIIFLDDGVFVVAPAGEYEKVQILDAFYYRPRPLPQVLRDFPEYVIASDKIDTTYCDFPCVFIEEPKDPWYGWFGGPWPDWTQDLFSPP